MTATLPPRVAHMREIERQLVEAEGPDFVESAEVYRLRALLEQASDALADDERNGEF